MIKIVYCCIDCGNRIGLSSARYGSGKCVSCAQLGVNNSFYNKQHSIVSKIKIGNSLYHKNLGGENNPMYGKHHTDEVKKRIAINNSGKTPWFGKQHSEETKEKISQSLSGKKHPMFGKKRPEHSMIMRGPNNPNWHNGISFEPYGLEWTKELRAVIRKRDNYTCQVCGKTEDKEKLEINRVLSVHHIDYNKQNCDDANLLTLCAKCNSIVNGNRDYWFAYFRYILDGE